MPHFMTQFSYTSEAWAEMIKNPQDRAAATSALIEKMGGKVLCFYFAFGEYDGLIISEAPDEKSVASSLLAAVAAGHLKTIKTTVLFTNEDAMDAMRMAQDVQFSGPGG